MTATNQIVTLDEDIETLKSLDVTGNQLEEIAERLVAVRNRLHYLERVCADHIAASYAIKTDGSAAGEKHQQESPGAGT